MEALLAAVASAASFALAGAAFTAIGSNLASDLVALAHLGGVVAVARLLSIAYAVPLAMDDGLRGASRNGNGLLGLQERLATHDGRLHLESPVDGGTLVSAAIPLEA